MKRASTRYLGFIPVPALIVMMAVLEIVVKPSLFYEPAWLLPITNTLFVTVVFFIVAYIAMSNYRATSRIQILLLGGGVLAFGIGGVIAALVRSVPAAGANLNVTIYNTGALIGAVFHFAAALILLAGIFPEVGSKRKEFWLVLSYVGVTAFMALFSMASLKGLIPPFFVQGVGPTALRQWVLGASDILFAFSFLIFMGLYLKNREVFLYWYALALALTSISLTAFFIQSAVGSPVGWIGRFSQYLGGVYFLTAIVTAMRSAQARRTSFDNVLTASLSPTEETFRALAEHSPDIITRFDKEMKHVYINQVGLRLYGKPAGSIIGKTIEEMGLPGPSASLLKERIQRVFETCQPAEVEHYIPTQSGVRFYQSRCVPEFGVDGTVANVLVVSHDLTERKQAEEALRESEQRYRSLFNGMTEGFALHEIICDAKDVPCDYRFLEINPAFERLTGLKRKDVVGNTMRQVLPDDDPKWVKIYGEVALTGKSIHFDNYSAALKRHYEVYAYCPAPRQFGVLFMDITEHKRGEEERARLLAEVQNRAAELDATISSMAIGLIVYNRAGNATLMNNTAKEVLPPEIFFNMTVEERLHVVRWETEGGHPFPLEEIPVARALRGETTYNVVIAAPFPDHKLWISASAAPIRTPDGKMLGAVASFVDITDRKRAEEELRRSRDELEIRVQERTAELKEANEALRQLSSKLLSAQEEERKRIAGEIHDTLGACLSAIKFKVEGAVQQIGETAAVATQSFGTILPVIQEGIEECRRMQQDLRPSILDDLGLLATLSWFCRRYQTIYTGIKVELEQSLEESDIPNVLKIVIFRVTQEGMNNIAKHSKADLVHLSLGKMDGRIELVLKDNGQGFDLKQALASERMKRGLGLTSMRERTELSGASFAIESKEGKGTTIHVSWPLGTDG